MIRKKNESKLFTILFIILLFSCHSKDRTQINEKENKKTGKIDNDVKLVQDFNFDNYPDTLKIKALKNKKVLLIYLSDKKTPIVSKGIIFPKGELYSEETNDMTICSFQKNTIIISQEYGDASPEGWYTCYINYNKNSKSFIVDSINNSWKNYSAKSDIDFIKSKTKLIRKKLEDFNAKSEFYNFK